MKNLIPWKWRFGGKKEHGLNTLPAMDNFISGMPFSLWNPLDVSLPSVDVSETEKEYTVKAEIPGLSEKDIDLTWHEGLLTIRGEKKQEKEEKGKNRYYRECSYGSFHRSIPLGEDVEWEKARARYKRGVLTVALPRKKTAINRKTIKIN